MPDTYTTSLKLTLPADGDTSWGSLVNNGVTSLVDEAVAGTQNIVLPAGTADRVLTSGDGSAPNEARKMFLNITGTPNGATNIICPAVSKLYFVNNATTIPVLTTTGASGTGSTATLTFAVQTVAPYTIGQTITVASVTPTGYNGTYVVTGSTTTTVSYASTTTGAQTVAGTVTAATFGITIKTPSGAGVSVANGIKVALYCNGTTVVTAVSSTVAGSDTQVQYNNAGAPGASANLIFDGTSLTVNGVKIGRGAVSTAAANLAIGPNALESFSGGVLGNTAVGSQALQKASSGFNLTALGYYAGQNITSGSNNTAIGASTLGSFSVPSTTSSYNTAVGSGALSKVNTGGYNNAVGWNAGSVITSGDHNVAIGTQALYFLDSGVYNTCIGNGSMYSASSASYNTAIGSDTLGSNISGVRNVGVGYFAGVRVSGDDSISIGYLSTGSSGNNVIVIGSNAVSSTATVSNEITLGNSSITTLRCQVTSITALSDARDKTNIQPLIPGLNFINRLNPVSFDWNMRDGGKVGVADTGFIAQDLKSCQSLTQEFIPGLVYESNPDKLEASYGKLIPVLVKAIQELTARVAELEGK